MIDDMENYDDNENRIYDTWLDGWGNETSSTVAYFEEPFAEKSIVKSGRQSMPLQYDNSAVPFHSEAELALGVMDLDTNGANTLRSISIASGQCASAWQPEQLECRRHRYRFYRRYWLRQACCRGVNRFTPRDLALD